MDVVEKEHSEQEAALPGLFGRYVRVFTSPDTLFRGLRKRPAWAGAMLLGSCLALAGVILLPPELTIATMRERMLEAGQPVPPGFGDQMAAFRYAGAAAAFVPKIIGSYSNVVGLPLAETAALLRGLGIKMG